MLRKTFDDAIQWLQKYFKTELSEQRVEKYFEFFQNEDDVEFAAIVANELPLRYNRLPTPEELRALIAERRGREYEKAKMQEFASETPLADMPVRSDIAGDWKEIIVKLFAMPTNRETREWLLQQYDMMHEKYPDCGFADAKERTLQFYKKRNLL